MRWHFPFPETLRARLAVMYFFVLSAAACIITFTLAAHIARDQLSMHERMSLNIIDLTRPTAQRLLINHNTAELRHYLGLVAQNPIVSAINIENDEGKPVYDYNGPTESASWLTQLLTNSTTRPPIIVSVIEVEQGRQGNITLTTSYGPLNRYLVSILRKSLLYSLLIVVLTVFIIYHTILRKFTRPLKSLTEFAREYARGEIGSEFNLTASKIREIQELNIAFAEGSATMRHYIHSLEETRELLEHSEQRLRTLIDGMHEILFELDREGRISFLNPAWQSITGHTIDDTLGKPITAFMNDGAKEIFSPENLPKLLESNREILFTIHDGEAIWLNLEAEAQFDGEGIFKGVIGTLGDITESVELNRMLSRYQEELYHLSVTDPLTGLYNRRHFDTQFDITLSNHLEQGQPLCLLLIDIDGFKFINDTYGHPFGDEVLKRVAELLRKLVRRNDYIARLAGDEFAMILKNTCMKDATRIAHKLHDNINQEQIDLPVGQIHIQTSIGVAEAPTHGNNAHELISAADVALYQGKRAGRNRVQILPPDISRATMTIFGQGFHIRNALETDNVIPVFQPICNIATGEIEAYEVLARMRMDGSLIPAGEFITVAEELGLTREIDLCIIEQALITSKSDMRLFVNVDLSSFNDPVFTRRLRDLIDAARKSSRELTIEITERESLPITDELLGDILELRELGCELALDDFGSGYSTYHFLDQFRPDYLKIEGSFVQQMLASESSQRIVAHINELANSFGMRTIAENIENDKVWAALRNLGIHLGQGYHLGRPVIYEELEAHLARQNAKS